MSLKLSKEMMSIIEEKVGMSRDKMKASSFEEIDRFIENKSKHKLEFGYEPGYSARGNILIQFRKIITPEEADKNFRKYFHA